VADSASQPSHQTSLVGDVNCDTDIHYFQVFFPADCIELQKRANHPGCFVGAMLDKEHNEQQSSDSQKRSSIVTEQGI
jgi:hypothetical protein